MSDPSDQNGPNDPGDPGAAALLEIADELYGEPTGRFIAERDRRARELKAAGETDLPRRVAALRKPSTAAWVLDLLVRREADQVDQVLAVGAALREAQAAMEAGELRALTKQRRQVTAALTQRARAVAGEAGVRVSEAVATQVEATLTAAMVDEACGRALRSGLLVSALSSTGVAATDPGVLAAALAVPDALGFRATPRDADADADADTASDVRPRLRVVHDPDAAAKALAAARERVEACEEAHAEAREIVDELDAEHSRLEARSLQIHAEAEELRGRIAELEADADEVEEETAGVEEQRAEAAADLRRADAERAEATAAWERLRDRHDRDERGE